MLALSPPLFSLAYEWPLEDLITTQTHLPNSNEANSYNNNIININNNNKYNSLLDHDLHIYNDQKIKHDFAPERSISSSGGAANGSTGDDTMVEKKITHNASERDRRKRINDLYAFLRSLLPISSDLKKKKVSIPKTLMHALKYIPELQKEVKTLRSKKEKSLSYSSSSIDNTTQDHLGIKKLQSADQDSATMIKTKSSLVSCISSFGDKEAVIQLVLPTDQHINTSKNKEISLLPKVLEYLEQEEDELVLLNATTLRCMTEGMLLTTLHLQVQGHHKIQAEMLKEKLCDRFLPMIQ